MKKITSSLFKKFEKTKIEYLNDVSGGQHCTDLAQYDYCDQGTDLECGWDITSCVADMGALVEPNNNNIFS